MRRFFIACFIASMGFSAASAQTIIIDPFSDAQNPLSQSSAGTLTFLQGGPGSLNIPTSSVGGFRNVTNTFVSGPLLPFTLNFNGSDLSSSASSDVLGNFLLEYGTQAQLNINASATNAFVFTRTFLDLNSNFTATIVSGNGAVTATFNGVILGGGGPSSDVVVPFANFTNGGLLNLNDIDSVSFQFTALQDSTDFTLDNIRFENVAVPEPATVAMIGLTGLGAAGGLYIRRRRNQKALNAAFPTA